jgi:selenoprotein W-related protein
VESALVEGSNGVFEVTVDGELVFSKKATHRFPDEGEVVRLISGR